MKRNRLFKCIILSCLIAIISCTKEKNTITNYIGTVVEGASMDHLPNVKVSVTNGSRVLVSTFTDEEGAFSFFVDVRKLQAGDSLLLDGSPDLPYQKRYALREPGKELYDYRTLVLYNKNNTTISTSDVTSIAATSAICGGAVNEGTDVVVSQRGVCWSKLPEPSLFNCIDYTNDGSGGGSFVSYLTGLEERTTYYVRAYVTNGERVVYGSQKTFTTEALFPSFQYGGSMYYVYPDAGEMTWQDAMVFCDTLTYAGYSDWFLPNKDELNAMYNHREEIGGFDLTGQYWSSTLYYGWAGVTEYAYFQWFGNGDQSWSSQGDRKRVRPIRENGGGGSNPVVITDSPLYVTSSSARCSGTVLTSGGTDIIERGICYNRYGYPEISDKVVKCGNGTGSFICSLTDLDNNTTYYCRAYAKNNREVYYGDVYEFETSEQGEGSLHYDESFSIYSVGFENGGTLWWGAMFPSTMLTYYDNMCLSDVEVNLEEIGTYTMRIFQGGTTAPSSMVYSQTYYAAKTGWNVICLSTPAPLDITKNLWVTFSFTHSAGQYPAGICYENSTNPNGRWISNGSGVWEDSEDYTWSIHAFVSNNLNEKKEIEISEIIENNSFMKKEKEASSISKCLKAKTKNN